MLPPPPPRRLGYSSLNKEEIRSGVIKCSEGLSEIPSLFKEGCHSDDGVVEICVRIPPNV